MNQDFYNDAAPVVPSDTIDGPFEPATVGTPGYFEALVPGGVTAGQTIAVVMQSGVVVTFTNPLQGALLRVKGRRVNSTGTTATTIVALRQV